MNNLSPIRRMVLAALFAALCVVLPLAFHAVPNAGSVFLPMHIPVLLCGLVCGWPYGLVCGGVGPLLSSLMTSMPPMAYLPPMMVECAVYGAVCGVMLRFLRTGRLALDLYIALGTAMVAGRVAAGIAKALIFTPGITMGAWVTASFVTAAPGILIQLILIPQVVGLLMKAKHLPPRYPR